DYDIILLDLNLPDMSGFDVLRKLRVSKVKSPILILSGLAGIEDKIKGLGFGADDYMTKPFHKAELVARVHAIVRRSKGHAQSVISTDGLCVNLDSKTVEIDGARVYLTGKGTPGVAQRNDAEQGNVLEQSLRRYRRARDEDYRRLYLQATKKTRYCIGRRGLHRDGVGSWLRNARASLGCRND